MFPKKHLLSWGCGLGKTFAVICLSNKADVPTLIIVPKSLKTQWGIEMTTHCTHKNWKIVTKEEFRRDWNVLKKYDCLIVDECHFFLGMKSAMSKALIAYLKKWQPLYFYGLTATPFRSSPWDIYRLLEIFGRKINYYSFFQTFFYNIKMGARMIPQAKTGPDIEAKLISLIHSVGSTVRLEDCFDVPEQVHEVIWVSLTKDQEKGMKNLDAILPIVRYGNEHQITGGVLKEDDYRPIQFFETQKIDVLLGLVADNKQMIVAFKYREEIEMVKKTLEKEFPSLHIGIIHGDIENRHEVLRECEKHDKYVLLISATVSEGWEMKQCPLMVFYSLSYSMVSAVQMQGRIQRAGSLKKNTYIFLVCKDTVDEAIYRTVILEKTEFHLAIYAKSII